MNPFATILISAAVGSIFSLLGSIITAMLAVRRERLQHVWQSDVRRIEELEERSGQLVELLMGYNSVESIEAAASEGLTRLSQDPGRFLRYDGVARAIRDLKHALSLLFDSMRKHLDSRPVREEVMKIWAKLLEECDAVTGRRGARASNKLLARRSNA